MISKTSCRTAISWQLFKLSAIFPTSRFTFIYTLVRHSYHHKNVIFLIHNMIDLRKGGGGGGELFKTWQRKAIKEIR